MLLLLPPGELSFHCDPVDTLWLLVFHHCDLSSVLHAFFLQHISTVKHFSNVHQKKRLPGQFQPRDQELLHYLFDSDIRRQGDFVEVSIPEGSKIDDDFGFVQVALVDDVDDSSFCEVDGEFVGVYPEAVVEEDDALMGQVEADGGQYSQIWGRGGGLDRYQFGFLATIAKENVDSASLFSVTDGFFVLVHYYLLQRKPSPVSVTTENAATKERQQSKGGLRLFCQSGKGSNSTATTRMLQTRPAHFNTWSVEPTVATFFLNYNLSIYFQQFLNLEALSSPSVRGKTK